MTSKEAGAFLGTVAILITALVGTVLYWDGQNQPMREQCKVTGETLHHEIVDVTPIIRPGIGKTPSSLIYLVKTGEGRLLELHSTTGIRLGKRHTIVYDCHGLLVSIQAEQDLAS